MATLVQAALTLRRGARAAYGYATALSLLLLCALGLFRELQVPGPEHVAVAVAFVSVLLSRSAPRLRLRASQHSRRLDLELGLLALAGAHALVQWLGGLTGPLYPLLYLLIAFTSSFCDRRSARLLLLAALAFEALLYFVTEGHGDAGPYLLHAAFLVVFGLLNTICTHAEIRRLRRDGSRELQSEKQRLLDDARLFRLVATPTDSAADEERLMRSSVQEVHQALFFTLEVLKRSLGLHSCVLLMDSGTRLRIVELCTDSDDIAEGPFAPGAGAVGAAYQRGLCMNLERLRPGYTGICYYREPAQVRAFVAVPVREGGKVSGVLCADRLDDRPFSAGEEALLASSIPHLQRAMENERVFVQLERSKREHSVLHRASGALGAAGDEPAVLQAALSAAAEIAPYDFAAVTQYDESTRQHSVRRAVGKGAEQFHNLCFRDNSSLTAMVVRNRHYLPYRGEFDAGNQVVYTANANLAGMQSLLILPLLVREEAIGTLALAAQRRDAFGGQQRPALSALANQLAVALSNAASVKRLSELATTDGLTGCFNKRHFNEELKQRLSAAERFGRKLSLIVTDIDHFKVVNDTYGHGTGDVVIRELGAILLRLKRDTDVVARFGGEEFCVLCEETGAGGAAQLAERVRRELEQTVFETELGKLKVTCSLGVATYPDHARHRENLFEMADRAMYAAKHAGRNQVAVGASRAHERTGSSPTRAA